MKKIPNLFERDWNGDKSRVLPILNTTSDVAWVLHGEGISTVKWDGSACLVRDGKLFVRYDAKRGKTPPPGFEPCQDEDPVTGHRPGWIPADGNPGAKWHLDAFMNSVLSSSSPTTNGTYEACGPQHQSNPYKFHRNILIRHGVDKLPCEQALHEALVSYQCAHHAFVVLTQAFDETRVQHTEMPAPMPIEGIVFHHPDGRMVKVLASDLGLAWKTKMRL